MSLGRHNRFQFLRPETFDTYLIKQRYQDSDSDIRVLCHRTATPTMVKIQLQRQVFKDLKHQTNKHGIDMLVTARTFELEI